MKKIYDFLMYSGLVGLGYIIAMVLTFIFVQQHELKLILIGVFIGGFAQLNARTIGDMLKDKFKD